MKKFRRFLAFGLSLALVLTPMTVGAENSGTATGDSYLEGVFPDDVVCMVVPTVTDATYKVLLDPHNLLKQYDEENALTDYADGKSVYFSTTGNPKFTDTSEIGTAVNKSTCDVLLDVNVTVTNVATNPVTFTSKADVNTGDDTNVYLGLVPTAKGTFQPSSDPTATPDPDAAPAPGALTNAQTETVDSTGTASATFLLKGDKDNFDIKQSNDPNVTSGHKYDYVAKNDASWSTAGFAIDGACNTNGDWKEYYEKSKLKENGENLKIKVIYSMAPLNEDEKAQITREENPVIANETTGLINLVRDSAPKGFLETTYSYVKGTETKLKIDLGAGSLKITPNNNESVVVSVKVGNTWYNLSSFGGAYSNGYYTIGADASISSWGTFDMKVAVNGTDVATAKITLSQN